MQRGTIVAHVDGSIGIVTAVDGERVRTKWIYDVAPFTNKSCPVAESTDDIQALTELGELSE